MRIFDHPNMENFNCPVCQTKEDKPVVLMPIKGTEDDGIVEAVQVHADCMAYWATYEERLIERHLWNNPDTPCEICNKTPTVQIQWQLFVKPFWVGHDTKRCNEHFGFGNGLDKHIKERL